MFYDNNNSYFWQDAPNVFVDLYIPRKCQATNRVIMAKDHASVQINIGHVDANGHFHGDSTPIALSGFIRKKALADAAINRFAAEQGLMKNLTRFPTQHKFKGNDE